MVVKTAIKYNTETNYIEIKPLSEYSLGTYVKNVGKKVNSDSLINSGEDAKLDSVISASTFVAAIIYIVCKVSLEAWLSVIISVIIIKSGLEMLKETVSHIIGEQGDYELANSIKKTVRDFEEVKGAYDLVLHNYGPDAHHCSIHIEVLDTFSVDKLDQLQRDIASKVYEEHNVIVTAIGVYSINTKDKDIVDIRKNVHDIVMSHKNVLQMHGFNVNLERKTMRFDTVISFDAEDRVGLYNTIVENVKNAYPGFNIGIVMDTDFNERA
ncbi:MAG: cation transporter, partial [Lachnospiraceae bacterium]|nr:cation transporter [Lachnospiraceae bacterium]